MTHSPELLAKAKKIKIVLLDVDGTLTDGRVIYSAANEGDTALVESKEFYVQDGCIIRWAQREGLEIAFVTGRKSRAVELRAQDLGISFCEQGVKDKRAFFEKYLKTSGVDPDTVAFMGDDLVDLPVMLRVRLAACPSDAVEEVKARSHFISQKPGGAGAVREFLEFLLKAQGRWDAIVQKYTG